MLRLCKTKIYILAKKDMWKQKKYYVSNKILAFIFLTWMVVSSIIDTIVHVMKNELWVEPREITCSWERYVADYTTDGEIVCDYLDFQCEYQLDCDIFEDCEFGYYYYTGILAGAKTFQHNVSVQYFDDWKWKQKYEPSKVLYRMIETYSGEKMIFPREQCKYTNPTVDEMFEQYYIRYLYIN